jgi:hypothetical protein
MKTITTIGNIAIITLLSVSLFGCVLGPMQGYRGYTPSCRHKNCRRHRPNRGTVCKTNRHGRTKCRKL